MQIVFAADGDPDQDVDVFSTIEIGDIVGVSRACSHEGAEQAQELRAARGHDQKTHMFLPGDSLFFSLCDVDYLSWRGARP